MGKVEDLLQIMFLLEEMQVDMEMVVEDMDIIIHHLVVELVGQDLQEFL